MTSRYFKKVSLLFFMMLLASASAFAQQAPKIGYTNLDYLLSLMPEVKQIESELQAYEKQLSTQLESKYQEYQKKMEEYQKGVSSGLMSDLVKQDKEKELVGLQTSIKEFEEKAQQDLQKKQVSLLEPVYDKIQKSIDKVAEANGYTYVLNTHADMGGSAIILYARHKDEDISSLVLKDLGVAVPTTAAPATITPANKK
ncbi:MAG: OmpH family outer membrane protein [Alphaproteobacteria bacterium]|jgi:outer membrane protein|nr:OmpH family outer membrane protein [Alphaproteobacteria bacterium]